MSTGLNAMAGVIWEDMIKPCFRRPVTETTAGRIMKFIVVIIGIICVCLVFVVEKLSTLIHVSTVLIFNYSFANRRIHF